MSMGPSWLTETYPRNLSLWESGALVFQFRTIIPKSFISGILYSVGFHKNPLTMLSMLWKVHVRKSFYHVIYIIALPPWSHKIHTLSHMHSCLFSTSSFSPSIHQGISFLPPSFFEININPTDHFLRENLIILLTILLQQSGYPPIHPLINLCSSSHLLNIFFLNILFFLQLNFYFLNLGTLTYF